VGALGGPGPKEKQEEDLGPPPKIPNHPTEFANPCKKKKKKRKKKSKPTNLESRE